jgi:NADH-quinone oxidoreductase subunit D
MLYNYIWIGGLYYDLPVGFEKVCLDFVNYLPPKLDEARDVLINNKIFIARTAGVGVLSSDRALAWAATGPMLRGSGFAVDSRRTKGYSVYPELEFDVPVGQGKQGVQGDCWDRTWVRLQECYESVHIIRQCLDKLTHQNARTPGYDPQAFVPKKIRPEAQQTYFSAETPRGDLGFFIATDGKSDIPLRCHVRSACFQHLALLPEISRGGLLADLVAVIGSLDFIMGEVDR